MYAQHDNPSVIHFKNRIKPTHSDYRSIAAYLRRQAAEYPNHQALVEDCHRYGIRRSWNYAQLLANANIIAVYLQDRFQTGDRIAVWTAKAHEWSLAQYGIALADMQPVMLEPTCKYAELEQLLGKSRVEGLIMTDTHDRFNSFDAARRIQKIIPSLQVVTSFRKIQIMSAIQNTCL